MAIPALDHPSSYLLISCTSNPVEELDWVEGLQHVKYVRAMALAHLVDHYGLAASHCYPYRQHPPPSTP